jgi:hypothetical protein
MECYYCDKEITGTPVTDHHGREWCSEEHYDSSQEQAYEQYYQPAESDPDPEGMR